MIAFDLLMSTNLFQKLVPSGGTPITTPDPNSSLFEIKWVSALQRGLQNLFVKCVKSSVVITSLGSLQKNGLTLGYLSHPYVGTNLDFYPFLKTWNSVLAVFRASYIWKDHKEIHSLSTSSDAHLDCGRNLSPLRVTRKEFCPAKYLNLCRIHTF